ncbi:MAG TPA: magnesium transporter CorA family protein [Mycobacteriales bacterium]|nr:magnesium transporter CorA family protein [Mycobacteriales bacterium]
MARTRVWRKGVLEAEDFPLEKVSDFLEQDDCVVWADLCVPHRDDLQQVADELGLDPLAVEDTVERHERPKADRYPTHLFVTTYALEFDTEHRLRPARISAFVLPRALVTVRQEAWFDIEQVVRRWDATPELAEYGVASLLYGLLDVVVDGHFEAVQQLDDRVEAIEDALFDDQSQADTVQRSTYELRKTLVGLRKLILPMREVVGTLLHHVTVNHSAELAERYHDLYDHVLRATEWSDSLRDLVTTIFETNLSLADARLNQVVKRLSAWAAIIAVPTAVTGFYGQNVPYPGFGQWWGFVTSTLVTVLLAGGIYLGFRRQGWI